MPRELDGYRDNLAILNERFPEHDMLTVAQIMEITGIKSPRTVRKHFSEKIVNFRLSKAFLARWMCGK